MAVIPAAQCYEPWMAEIALEIARHARHVAQIAALAVSLGEAGEDAQNFRRPLRAEKCIGRAERGFLEAASPLPQRAIFVEQPVGQSEVHIDTRILKQRRQVEGRMAQDTVLSVDEANSFEAVPLRQPH